MEGDLVTCMEMASTSIFNRISKTQQQLGVKHVNAMNLITENQQLKNEIALLALKETDTSSENQHLKTENALLALKETDTSSENLRLTAETLRSNNETQLLDFENQRLQKEIVSMRLEMERLLRK